MDIDKKMEELHQEIKNYERLSGKKILSHNDFIHVQDIHREYEKETESIRQHYMKIEIEFLEGILKHARTKKQDIIKKGK